jgi:hypothetical protein
MLCLRQADVKAETMSARKRKIGRATHSMGDLLRKGRRLGMIHFTNLDELRKQLPSQRVYCHFMLKAVKG